MTEQEWLTSEDPAAMLDHLMAESGLLSAGVSYQDAMLALGRIFRLWVEAMRAISGADGAFDLQNPDQLLRAAQQWARRTTDPIGPNVSFASRAHALRDIRGNPFRSVILKRPLPWIVTNLATAAFEETGRKCDQCHGLGRGRMIEGGDFVPGPRPPVYAKCKPCNGTGRIDDGTLDPQRLAVLADALEEAGCQEEALLRHLRRPPFCVWCKNTGKVQMPLLKGGPESEPEIRYIIEPSRDTEIMCICRGECGPHVRGCWAIDFVTGRC